MGAIACFHHLYVFLVYIAAVKQSSLLLIVALVCLPVFATDEQPVTVTNSSLVKKRVQVNATLQGKPAAT